LKGIMSIQDYAICCGCGQRDLIDIFTSTGEPKYTSAPHNWINYTCKQCDKESELTINDYKDNRGESGSWESMTEYFETLEIDGY